MSLANGTSQAVVLESCESQSKGQNEVEELGLQGMPKVSSSSREVADISSKRDLAVLCEVEDAETGAFLRSTYGYIDHSECAWFGRMPGVRKYDLTIDDLKRTMQEIPDEHLYPIAIPPITIAPQQRGDDANTLHIKRPQLAGRDDARSCYASARIAPWRGKGSGVPEETSTSEHRPISWLHAQEWSYHGNSS